MSPLPDSYPLMSLIPLLKTWLKQVQASKVRTSPLRDCDIIESYRVRIFATVALHRFIDYVPLVVDTELVRGMCQDLTLALRQSFKFSEPNLVERCNEYLQEHPDVKNERESLEQKLRRLTRAEVEIHNFWT